MPQTSEKVFEDHFETSAESRKNFYVFCSKGYVWESKHTVGDKGEYNKNNNHCSDWYVKADFCTYNDIYGNVYNCKYW